MKIRGMRVADFEPMIELEHKELYPELTPEQIATWMEGEGDFVPWCLVAEEQGELVGFVVTELYDVRDEEIVIELSAIAVKKEKQGQGIGKALLEQVVLQEKRRWAHLGFRLKGLLIETNTDEAGPFYEKVFPNFQKWVVRDIWEDGEGMVFYFVPFPQSL